MSQPSYSLVLWIDNAMISNENKKFFKEIESINSIQFQKFNEVDKTITNLKSNELNDTKIIVKDNLFSEFIKKFLKNKSDIRCTPKIIIFTRDRQNFIDNNKEYQNDFNMFYIIWGIATTFEEINQMLKK